MSRVLWAVLLLIALAGCVSPTITGPSNLHDPPRQGWTVDQVRAHWGTPYSTSWYNAGGKSYETWIYRRSYFVSGAYGSHIEADFASVSFVDEKVVGVSY
jgi:hypothetical protein